MPSISYRPSPSQAERTIATARVALAISSLFAVWLDPAEPARYTQATYVVHSMYVAYSVLMVAYVWRDVRRSRVTLGTHIADIAIFSVFQYLTLGPSSPFFVYFIFSLFCGALRWGWRGTLRTAGAVIVSYLSMGAWMSQTLGSSEFELNRFIIRTVYLAVTAFLLVHLGRHEERLRDDIERLARWPALIGGDTDRLMEDQLRHAARIVQAQRTVMLWDVSDEPDLHLATLSPQGFVIRTHAPGEFDPIVSPEIDAATFLSATRLSDPESRSVLVSRDEHHCTEVQTAPVHERLRPIVDGLGVVSAAFRTERVVGRVFFSDLATPAPDLLPLTQVVARELGASFDQLYVNEQLRAVAASEERIRVARDLHDGVLQALTGVRLELRAAASGVEGVSAPARDRMLAIERAVAIEQRELRMFIDDLKPGRIERSAETLRERLEALRDRVSLEWKAVVTIRAADDLPSLSAEMEQKTLLMIHEAVVNALKHAGPSRVNVTLDASSDILRLTVADDGHGFPFEGRYTHAALTHMNSVPKSLLDRVTALGGELSIESSARGSRVEMTWSL